MGTLPSVTPGYAMPSSASVAGRVVPLSSMTTVRPWRRSVGGRRWRPRRGCRGGRSTRRGSGGLPGASRTRRFRRPWQLRFGNGSHRPTRGGRTRFRTICVPSSRVEPRSPASGWVWTCPAARGCGSAPQILASPLRRWPRRPENVGVHHPSVLALDPMARLFNAFTDLSDASCDQRFAFGAEVGAPVDLDVALGKLEEGAAPIEHDDDRVVDPVGRLRREVTAGGDDRVGAGNPSPRCR